MKLTLTRPCESDDWYFIEKAEHDGKTWWERIDSHTHAFRRSARISDAEVEGTAAEMLALAAAIIEKTTCSFKRCAVECANGCVYLWSPRNSQEQAEVSMDDARDLAEQIHKALGAKTDEHD